MTKHAVFTGVSRPRAALALAVTILVAPVPAAHGAGALTDADRAHLADYCEPQAGADVTDGAIAAYGDYEVLLCPGGDELAYHILVRGVSIAEGKDQRVAVAYFGDDIAGAGYPLLVLQVRSGSDCCAAALIYEVSPRRFRPLGLIDGGFGTVRFDREPDTVSIVATVQDPAWAYWRTNLPDAGVPSVRLQFHQFAERFVFSSRFMTAATPSEADLRAEAAALQRGIDPELPSGVRAVPYQVPVELWQRILQLIYAGQGNLARRYVEWAWPTNATASRDTFWHELAECNLRHSAYFEDVYALNRWPISQAMPADCQNWSDLF